MISSRSASPGSEGKAGLRGETDTEAGGGGTLKGGAKTRGVGAAVEGGKEGSGPDQPVPFAVCTVASADTASGASTLCWWSLRVCRWFASVTRSSSISHMRHSRCADVIVSQVGGVKGAGFGGESDTGGCATDLADSCAIDLEWGGGERRGGNGGGFGRSRDRICIGGGRHTGHCEVSTSAHARGQAATSAAINAAVLMYRASPLRQGKPCHEAHVHEPKRYVGSSAQPDGGFAHDGSGAIGRQCKVSTSEHANGHEASRRLISAAVTTHGGAPARHAQPTQSLQVHGPAVYVRSCVQDANGDGEGEDRGGGRQSEVSTSEHDNGHDLSNIEISAVVVTCGSAPARHSLPQPTIRGAPKVV